MGLGEPKRLQILPFPYPLRAPAQPQEGRRDQEGVLWDPLCQPREGSLKSQDIQTSHLLEKKLPLGLKQPHFFKATVTEQHTGDGTWMHRAPPQHGGTAGTWHLRAP